MMKRILFMLMLWCCCLSAMGQRIEKDFVEHGVRWVCGSSEFCGVLAEDIEMRVALYCIGGEFEVELLLRSSHPIFVDEGAVMGLMLGDGERVELRAKVESHGELVTWRKGEEPHFDARFVAEVGEKVIEKLAKRGVSELELECRSVVSKGNRVTDKLGDARLVEVLYKELNLINNIVK